MELKFDCDPDGRVVVRVWVSELDSAAALLGAQIVEFIKVQMPSAVIVKGDGAGAD